MDEKTVREFAKGQLDFSYTLYRFDRENAFKLRSWCITVAMALLATLLSNKLSITPMARFLLVACAVIPFWIAEAMHMTLARLTMEHSQKLAGIILGITSVTPRELIDSYTLESTFHNIPRRQKLRIFLRCAFTTETVFGFYVLLLGCIVGVLIAVAKAFP